MIVTLATVCGQSKINPAEGLHSIGRVDRQIFFVDGAAFVGRHCAALKATGDKLVDGRILQKIAGKLFNRKLIERLIAVERPDHPVSIRPHFTVVVKVHAVRVGVASGIQPIAAAMFAPRF